MKKKLGEIRKSGAKVEMWIKEFKGHTYLDVRRYYFSSASNTWEPTRKGFTMTSPEEAKKIVALLQEGIETLRW